MPLPTQDQSPLSEFRLSNGNIIRVYQCVTGNFSNICAQLVDGTTGTNIGNAVAITNSTTAHQVWPTVTEREIFYVNSSDNKVYRCPITIASNTITPGSTAAVPLFNMNYWTSIVAPHYSIDPTSTNRTYLCGQAGRFDPRNNDVTLSVLAGVYFNVQGSAASNSYLNDQNADYPSASGAGFGFVDGGINLKFYTDVVTQTTHLTVNTGAIGSSGNKLRIDELSDGSRLFAWQVKNADGSWKVLTRRLSVIDIRLGAMWLDSKEVTVYTLPAGNGEPQPNVVVNPNGGYYIVGREICPGKTTVGICSREYRNDGSLVNTAVSVIEDAQAQFPTGSYTNGKLFVSACELDASTGNCTAIISNANAMSPTSVPTITSTGSLANSLTTLSQLMVTPTSITSVSMVGTATTTNQNTMTGTTLNPVITTATNNLPNGSPISTNNVISSSSLSSSTASIFSAISPNTFGMPVVTDQNSVLSLSTSSITRDSMLSSLNNPSSPFTSTRLPGENSSPNNNMSVIIGGVVGGTVALLAVAGLAIWKWARGKNKNENKIGKEMKSVELGVGEVSSKRASQYGSIQVQQPKPNQYDSVESPLGEDRVPVNYEQLPAGQRQSQYDRVSDMQTAQLGRPATPGYSSARPANEKGSEVEYSGLDATGARVVKF